MSDMVNKRRISRRAFARDGALAVAAGLPVTAAARGAQAPSDQPALSAASQTEVDLKVAAILRQYGQLLSDAEKLDVRRLLTEGQPQLDTMREFRTENWDQPANVLRLYPDAAALRAPAGAKSAKK